MALESLKAETRYGNSAEGGAPLMKKFKRAVIQAGPLKGARYTDVSESDIRRGAKAYRGDQRFAQFCKQWVASTVVAPDEVLKVSDSSSSGQQKDEGVVIGATWKSFCKNWGKACCTWALNQFKGRCLTSCLLLFLVLVIVCRPAFGKLCGKVVGLSIRVFLKRAFGLVTLVLDSILEEAASQVEQALLPQPFVDHHQHPGGSNQPIPHTSTSLQWTMHILCILVGSLLGRSLPRAIPAALESRS